MLKSVLFWFVVTCLFSQAILYFHFLTPIDEIWEAWSNLYSLLSSFMAGLIISFSFYFLVVHLPQSNKRKVLKSNFHKIYLDIKKDILREIIWSAQKGGRKDLHVDTETLSKLMNYKGFREAFEYGKEHDEGWYAFTNGVTEDKHYQSIIDKFQILAKQVEYLLLNYEIDNPEFFEFFKRLEMILLESKSLDPRTDDVKPFCRLLWDIYAGPSFGDGIQEFDVIENTIRKL